MELKTFDAKRDTWKEVLKHKSPSDLKGIFKKYIPDLLPLISLLEKGVDEKKTNSKFKAVELYASWQKFEAMNVIVDIIKNDVNKLIKENTSIEDVIPKFIIISPSAVIVAPFKSEALKFVQSAVPV